MYLLKASLENQQALAIGKCYELACMCCGACGTAGNLVTVNEGTVGVVTRFGTYHRMLGSGRHRFNLGISMPTETGLSSRHKGQPLNTTELIRVEKKHRLGIIRIKEKSHAWTSSDCGLARILA